MNSINRFLILAAILFSNMLLTTNTILAQRILYSSDAYTINQNAVYQGQYEAGAISPFEIKSNYESAFRRGTKKVISFKFSINGFDNELPSSQHHMVLLEPENNQYITPVFTFGEEDPEEIDFPDEDESYFPNDQKITAIFRVDLSKVLREFNKTGFFQTFDGGIINKRDFKGIYIAGDESPLNWDFEHLAKTDTFRLTDADQDSIYEISITFEVNPQRPVNSENYSEWKLSEDISNYPQLNSSHTLIDALYNLSLEELILNIRSDSTFMAGAKWPGIWTRDISYSILLALAITNPEISKKSLMAKVKDGRIIQDTGTGGSWPVSSDRMSWALAAWELYVVTGDNDWLKTSFRIIKASAEADLKTLIDNKTGLFYGESSFLDWREQSNPDWMDPKDIFMSLNLSTNAVHFQTYKILAEMATILGEPNEEYLKIAQNIKNAINTYFWMAEKGYYGQFLYGRNYKVLSPRSDALGEALSVLFNLSGDFQKSKVIENTPLLEFGIPCIFPQIDGIPSYHNNGIWPFVQAFFTWAAAKTKNERAVNFGLASIYRSAALFLSNKENMVASTGNFVGTEINSDRQLWSVAGNLAMIYRILLGMEFSTDGFSFNPLIPRSFQGTYSLKNFSYRNANFELTISGFGDKIDSVYFDGKLISSAEFPSNITGNHTIKIIMNYDTAPSKINIVENHFTPVITGFEFDDGELFWDAIDNDPVYIIYRNGNVYQVTADTEIDIPEWEKSVEFQVLAVDDKGYASFLSKPIWISNIDETFVLQPDKFRNKIHSAYEGYTGDGYIPLTTKQNTQVTFTVQIENTSNFSLDFRYANGNGPINTDNKCAVRSLTIDGSYYGVIVFPQRGVHSWTNWGYTNNINVRLTRGEHVIQLDYNHFNKNMNVLENVAFLDHLRLRTMQGN